MPYVMCVVGWIYDPLTRILECSVQLALLECFVQTHKYAVFFNVLLFSKLFSQVAVVESVMHAKTGISR